MRRVKYTASLLVKLEPDMREAIESIAMREQVSLGGAARALLAAGLTSKEIHIEGV